MKVILSSKQVPPSSLYINEVEELRESLRRSQMQCEIVERERDYHIAKAKELNQILESRATGNEPALQLIEKATEFAELSHEADHLRSQLDKSMDRIKELEQDCKSNRSVLVELSQIFRSVTANGSHQDFLIQMEALRINDNENSKEDDSPGIINQILSPQQALDLTLLTLREQIEALEDERQNYIGRIRALQNMLEEQRRENEARELKIIVLEKQMDEFWSENMALKEYLDNSLEAAEFAAAIAAEADNNKPIKISRKKFGWRVRSTARRSNLV